MSSWIAFRFNKLSNIEILNHIDIDGTFVNAAEGEIFGRVSMSTQLSMDTAEGMSTRLAYNINS